MRSAARAIIRRDGKLLVMRRDKFGHRYYTLVGGGIAIGETPQVALARELYEETMMKLTHATPVFKEEAGAPYGTQYIYVCECEGEEPIVSPNSVEATLNKIGKNTHTPVWISVEEFRRVPFRSERLQRAILDGIKNGFPEKPKVL
jgi:8-oxo-dGTP diphosphatase